MPMVWENTNGRARSKLFYFHRLIVHQGIYSSYVDLATSLIYYMLKHLDWLRQHCRTSLGFQVSTSVFRKKIY